MNTPTLLRLMYAVLDGEADAGEKAALARHLADDPAAREEFDELSRLFGDVSRIPKAYPPEGLVASVMAQIPPQFPASAAGQDRLRQPFSRHRVIGADSRESPDTIPGISTGTPRSTRQGPYFRSDDMSEQKSGSSGKRKILIGGGIAAVAVILAISSESISRPAARTRRERSCRQRYKRPRTR
jgi:anti-sigma factor RsiW